MGRKTGIKPRPLGEITAAVVRELYAYDPETGHLTWRVRRAMNAPVGSRVGTPNGHGYLCTKLSGRLLRVSRLIWLHVYGEWPQLDVDHANGDRLDNRLSNLRLATAQQNSVNRAVTAVSGFKGVYPNRRSKRLPWTAQLHVKGERLYLGAFATAEEAAAAVRPHLVARDGDFARLEGRPSCA